MAPFTPFVTEEVWARAVAPGLADARRLGAPRLLARPSTRTPGTTPSWPRWTWSGGSWSSAARPGRRRRSAPASRWPGRVVAAPGWAALPRDLVAEVADELNVVELVELAGAVGGELVDVSLKIDFRAVGPPHGQAGAGRREGGGRRRPGGARPPPTAPATATVEVDGTPVPLEDGDLIVTETPREGWTVASGAGLTVALDLDAHPGARAGRPRPRGRPAGAGGPQEQRPGGQRPDRAVVDRRRARWPRRSRSTARSGPARCWPPRCTPATAGDGDGHRGPRRAHASGWPAHG